MANTIGFPACWIDFNSIAVASLRPLLHYKCLFDHESLEALSPSPHWVHILSPSVVYLHHRFALVPPGGNYQKGAPLLLAVGGIDYDSATAVLFIPLLSN